MRLDEMTSADVARLRRKPVVLLPIGAVEQHGPHLPLGADILQPLSDYDLIYASEFAEQGEGHAGKIETSRLLAQHPGLVKGRAPRGTNRIPRHAVVRDARRYWPGVTGDPGKASRALGQRIDRLVERELIAIVRAALRRRP